MLSLVKSSVVSRLHRQLLLLLCGQFLAVKDENHRLWPEVPQVAVFLHPVRPQQLHRPLILTGGDRGAAAGYLRVHHLPLFTPVTPAFTAEPRTLPLFTVSRAGFHRAPADDRTSTD